MKLELKRITNAADLLQWAAYINNTWIALDGCRGMMPKCDLQDIYARSSREALDQAFIDCGSERRLVICSVNNIMAFEEVEHLLQVLARHKVGQERKELYTEYDEKDAWLCGRERALKESMKPYHKRMAELRKRNEFLERSFSEIRAREVSLVEDARAARREVRELQAKADKYDSIRELLA